MSGYGSASGGKSSSTSATYMDPAQRKQFIDIWGRGSNVMNQQLAGNYGQDISQLGEGLQTGMLDMFGGLGQTAAGTSQAMQGLGAQGQVGGGNPYLQQNLDALGAGINKQVGLLNQELGMGAVGAGGLGGGREDVAQGLIGQGALDSYQQGASSLLNQSAQQSLQANTALGGMQTQAGLGGLQGAGSIFQMGMAPEMAQYLPMQMQQGLLGQNIMNNNSYSRAWNASIAGGGGTK